MSFIDPVHRADLGTTYTHYGWFLGLVPVYIGDVRSGNPVLAVRNWCPDAWFWIVFGLFMAFCWFSSLLVPNFDPHFPIAFTGRIDGTPLSGPDGSMR